LASFAAATIVIRLALPLLQHRVRPWQLIHFALIATGLNFVLYPFFEQVWILMTLSFVLGLGLGSTQPSILALLQQNAPAGRAGEAFGLRMALINGCQVTLPLAFGALGAVIGVMPLFWQMGSAPYLGGGFGHFYAYAPAKFQYAIDRFTMETKRQLDVLDRRLAVSEYLGGDQYTIADIAVFPWYGGLVKGWLYGAAEFLSVQDYKHVQRWAETVYSRPAVKRGRMVNRMHGEPAEQLRERHDASDFDTKTQDKIQPAS
jgi:MFS family permease